MFHNYILLIILAAAVSQTLKYIISLFKTKDFSRKHARHIYMFSSGIPSSHTTVLTASLLYLSKTLGWNNPIVLISVTYSLLWLYEIYLQRKRFRALAALLDVEEEQEDDLIFFKDLSGHDLIDLFVGFILGVVIYKLFILYFL
ncbi:MAG TPA: divergent PAP2 family protein [Candidatus Saccharimonadales bacterium]|nr:divergent PAP2 family protein [Candidatus Saccharimonadales bacterium]